MDPTTRRSLLMGLGSGVLLGLLLVGAGTAGTLSAGRGQAAPMESAPQKERQRNWLHQRMEALMDRTMGEGFSHDMHAAMPGSEELMERMTARMAERMDREDLEAMLHSMEEMMAEMDMGEMGGMMRSPMMRDMMSSPRGRSMMGDMMGR